VFFLRHFERLFVLVLVATMLGIHYWVDQKLAFLSFYYLPMILAGFYGGRRFAVIAGVFIAGVLRGGPADRAGVRPGDVLLALNGKAFNAPSDLLNGVAALKPGQTATFALRRGSEKADVQVTVGRRPRPTAKP